MINILVYIIAKYNRKFKFKEFSGTKRKNTNFRTETIK